MTEPRLIKRYANRKLYDTTAKRYVTLEQIATLVRDGEEIKVVENDTGADLTSITLSQILVEQEKKRAGNLPKSFLTELVKSSSTLFDQVRRTVASWLHTAHISQEDVQRHLDELVRKGQLTVEEAQRLRAEIARRTDHLLALIDREVDAHLDKAVRRLGLARHEEIAALQARVERLAEAIDRALEQRAARTQS